MTIEGVRSAFAESVTLALYRWMGDGGEEYGVTEEHLRDMRERIMDPNFSLGKANRWLGWVQGVLCGLELATLEEVKEINRRYTDDR